ncbi:hypothetical protein HK105_204528 [Polyrhizophydium stewartii]|uniref:Uncharacterized protein n=1 Tax=Polyrhizophydium stewartii TaxID=2732419 RepID=A0ABR4N8J0_9FUNG
MSAALGPQPPAGAAPPPPAADQLPLPSVIAAQARPSGPLPPLPPLPLHFVAPEGIFVLREQVASDTAQTGPPLPNPRFGTILLSKSSKSSIKKVKPQLSKAAPLLVSKILLNEQLAKILSFRPPETTYVLYNIGRSFFWADMFSKSQNPLSIIQFKDSFVTCHDANPLTRETMDSVLGFSTGDILWYSPISGKMLRLNRQGVMHKMAVTSIKWLPGSDSQFMAGFEDGSILFFDKDFEDQPFSAPQTNEDFMVWRPGKQQKHNPIAYWKGAKKAITAISFSLDCQNVAFTSLDGTLKVVDYFDGKLLDTHKSYFGGLTCVAWSPDGKFIIAGGQDDLVSVWTFRGRIVARCQGHSSWVTGVAFDHHRCTDRNYRFGSVGEDTRLCLWDFSISSLHRPRSIAPSKYGSMPRSRSRLDVDRRVSFDAPVVHEPLPKSQVPIIESFAQCKGVHDSPLCSIAFREDCIVTSDKSGFVRIWNRPQPV